MANLKDKYDREIVPALRKTLGARNPMMVPRLHKVVVNMGTGIVDKDAQKALVNDLRVLTGQQPVVRRARKSISNFKLRDGMPVGLKVTLRGGRMFDFLDRLIHVALPRIRDFRGISSSGFDGRGNFSFGLREQSIFPEIDPNHVTHEQGMDVTLVTSAHSNEAARELLTALGIPFADKAK